MPVDQYLFKFSLPFIHSKVTFVGIESQIAPGTSFLEDIRVPRRRELQSTVKIPVSIDYSEPKSIQTVETSKLFKTASLSSKRTE
jgi:hypothetical protein